MRWVNAQLARVLGWVERAIQQEVVTLVFILHVHEATSCGIIRMLFFFFLFLLFLFRMMGRVVFMKCQLDLNMI